MIEATIKAIQSSVLVYRYIVRLPFFAGVHDTVHACMTFADYI